MMHFNDVRALLMRHSQDESVCTRELSELLSGQVAIREIGSGKSSARIELATFRIRAATTRAAGIETCGFDQTLDALSQLPDEAVVWIFTFSTHVKVFNVFVSDDDLIGCIRVSRRRVTRQDRPELHGADVSTLLRKYTETARAHRATVDAGDLVRTIQYRDAVWSIYRELRRRGSERELLSLLERHTDDVRAWAAGHALEFSPADGERVLNQLSVMPGALGASARRTLEEWRIGWLGLDS